MNVLLFVIIIGHICPINKSPGFTEYCETVIVIGSGVLLKIESEIAVAT